MADLDRLLDEFAADYEAGRATDVAALLDRVPAEQRQELASRLDTFLMQAPRRRWDPAAYEGSLAQAAVERVYESIEGVSGTWPELLPATAQPRPDQAPRAGRAAGRVAGLRIGSGDREGRRLLQPDGARDAPRRGRLRPGDRSARDDRRRQRRGDQIRRCPAPASRPPEGPRSPAPPSRTRTTRPRRGSRTPTPPPRRAPPSGTRSTPSSSTAERAAARYGRPHGRSGSALPPGTIARRWRGWREEPRSCSPRSLSGSGTARPCRSRSRTSPTPTSACSSATSRT